MQEAGITVGADEWAGRTGAGWAAEWRRTDRSFAGLTERLLQRCRDFAFESALDIGCGAGELTLAIARGWPECRITGVDISPQLVAVAQERGANRPNAAFVAADAATWRPETPWAPQLLVSRHGVMFFPDPVLAFAHLRQVAAPGAGLLFSCFRAWNENPAFTEVARLLPEPPPPPSDAPGPFAFSDRARVQDLLVRAGWSDIVFEPYDFAMVVGAGEDPIEDTVGYFTSIGPAARALRDADDARRDTFFADLRGLAHRNLYEGIVSLRAATWIVAARRA